MKIKLRLFALFIILSLISKSLFSQEIDKSVFLIVHGVGNSPEEAKQKSLESALELVFRTFVSSNSEFIKKQIISKHPYFITSISNELTHVANLFSLPVQTSESIKYVRQNLHDSIKINFNELNFDTQLKKGVMPNLQGLSAKDALFLLENNGLKIRDFDYNAFFKKRLDRNFKFNFKVCQRK
jgi:hypothetical protein